jgi:hypothetical protein
MNLSIIQQKAGQFLTDNASSILTAVGVAGTVATGVLTAKATFKAAELIQEIETLRDDHRNENGLDDENYPMTKTEKVKLVWPQYIPPVLVATATIGSIVAANMMSAKRAAALAAAYGLSERNLREYKDKVTEKLGVGKEKALRDEIAQDRVTENPPKEVIIITNGDVLCYDMLTGRYFQSTVENIKKAENRINQELFNHQYASLSMFYEEIGLQPTNFTDEVGWNTFQTGALEVRFSTTTSPDDRPCIAIDFNNPPKPDYTQLY